MSNLAPVLTFVWLAFALSDILRGNVSAAFSSIGAAETAMFWWASERLGRNP